MGAVTRLLSWAHRGNWDACGVSANGQRRRGGGHTHQFDSAHVMGAVPRLLSPRWLRSGSRRGDVAARGVEGGRDEW
jgi:hypothetical protein